MANEKPSDPAAQARKLIEEGTGKTQLLPADLAESAQFSKMPPTARAEYYSRKVQLQLEAERDRLLRDRDAIIGERDALRLSERELIALKSCLVRDRWETAVAIIAMAVGGGFISSDAKQGVIFALGWALVIVVGIWQIGKTLWITVIDWYNMESQVPAPPAPPVRQLD